MADIYIRRKLKKVLFSPAVLIILFLLVIFLAYSVYGVYNNAKESRRRLVESKEQLSSLSEKQLALLNNLDELKKEEGIEKEVREKYNLSKPGEKLVIIVDPKKKQDESDSAEESWFSGLLNKIKEIF